MSDKQPRYWQEGHLSFSGGGFIGIYHVGVVLAFKEFAPHIVSRKALGTSSGALATTCVVADLPIYDAIDNITKMAIHCRSLTLGPMSPRFNIGQIMRNGLEQCLPADAHLKCSGRMFISTTRVSTMTNEVFSEFASRQELVEVLLASCFIPYFLGLVPPTIRGARYVDGGATDNLPVHDENTITVSAFAGIACIRPPKTNPFLPDVIYTPENAMRLMKTMFSPPPIALEQLCQQGYMDAKRFIREQNLYACHECARLAEPPERLLCSACNRLFVKMDSAEIESKYLLPLRRAQEAEDQRMRECPDQHTTLMRTLTTCKAVAWYPVEAVAAIAAKTYNSWDDISEVMKRSLNNCWSAMWNSALTLLNARQNTTMCGGPATALEVEPNRSDS